MNALIVVAVFFVFGGVWGTHAVGEVGEGSPICIMFDKEDVAAAASNVLFVIALNDDDDDRNGFPDRDDGVATTQENDMVELRLDASAADVANGVELSAEPRRNLRVWTRPEKGRQSLLDLPAIWPVGSNGTPDPLYVEGVETSRRVSDTELLVSCKRGAYPSVSRRLTVVDAEFEMRGALAMARALRFLSEDDRRRVALTLRGWEPFGLIVGFETKPFSVVIRPEEAAEWTTLDMVDPKIASVEPVKIRSSTQAFALKGLSEGDTVMSVRVAGRECHSLPIKAVVEKWILSYCVGYSTPEVSPEDKFRDAVSKGDVGLAGKLLDAGGVDVNKAYDDGRFPVHLAVEQGGKAMLAQLLKAGASVNSQDGAGYTPLHLAVRKGNEAIVEYLVEAKATIDAQDKGGCTPLHHAILEGHKSLALFLIRQHSDVHATGIPGATPLHLAAMKGWTDVVKELLNAGADIHALTCGGYDAIEVAELARQNAVVKMLRKRVAEKGKSEN